MLLKTFPHLDARLGRMVFGNLTSFSYNYHGRSSLRNLRKKNTQVNRKSLFLHNMARFGFYKLPFLIPPEVMTKVVDAYQAALNDPNRSTDVMSTRAQQDGLDIYCRSVDGETLPEMSLLLTPEINRLIQSYFGGFPKVQITCARRNQYIPPHIAREYDIYSNSWHCDNEPSDRIKMFVALSPIDENCGPLHLLPRPRTRQIIKQGFKNRDDYGIPLEVIEDPRHLVKFEGDIGAVMFANVTQCLHRAGVPAVGHYRDIAELQFRGS